MKAVEELRNGLIEKIMAIQNKDYLEVLDRLISTNISNSDLIELNDTQKELLEMSEKDISEGRLISHEEMIKRNSEWLNAM
jgi:hypothetical protein